MSTTNLKKWFYFGFCFLLLLLLHRLKSRKTLPAFGFVVVHCANVDFFGGPPPQLLCKLFLAAKRLVADVDVAGEGEGKLAVGEIGGCF